MLPQGDAEVSEINENIYTSDVQRVVSAVVRGEKVFTLGAKTDLDTCINDLRDSSRVNGSKRAGMNFVRVKSSLTLLQGFFESDPLVSLPRGQINKQHAANVKSRRT